MRTLTFRILSAFLCLALLLPLVWIPTLAAEGEAVLAEALNDGTAPSSGSWSKTENGITYTVNRTLRYLGGRRYRVEMTVTTDINSDYSAPIRTEAEHGYDVVQNDGWYLLELWGGRGGEGEDCFDELLNTMVIEGGDGGSSGYVCAMVYLKKGQVLVHSIGTNGGQSVQYDDGQGGVNGDGGGKGDSGAKTVGGGGGFSVFYLIDGEEFEYDVLNAGDPNWITDEAVNLPEEIRTSRYIMIAGGGGGGGAYPSLSLLGGDALLKPNGGRGGSSEAGYLSLLGSDYDVPGYVFSGANGSSSGSSTSYVGRGGSNVPGRDVTTILNLSSASTQPNDWTGTYSTQTAYGGGGAGNLRGGGGGAGFCGGSGGIMTGVFSGSNVGGGGGGSSFLAATVNGEAVLFGSSIPGDIRTVYVEGAYGQPVGSSVGGACQITYLGAMKDQYIDTAAFENVTLDTFITSYFEIDEASVTVSDSEAVVSITETGLTLTGLSVLPRTSATPNRAARVSFEFSAKDGFAGGNAINAISSIDLSLLDPLGTGETVAFTADSNLSLDDVNVPLSFVAKGNSYTSDTVGQSYNVSVLYTDDYSSVRNSLSSHTDYDGIASISTYSVYLKDTDTKVTGTVAPTVNTLYDVKFTVTLKSEALSEVTVGPQLPLENVFSAVAAIGVIPEGLASFSNMALTTTKKLTHSSGTFLFDLGINLETAGTALMEDGSFVVNSTTVSQWSAPADGWYCVQGWGANGGSGQTATIYGGKSTSATAYGGSGGAGSRVKLYVYLHQGDVLEYETGTAGTSRTTPTTTTITTSFWGGTKKAALQGTGGTGGTRTTIKLNGVDLIIAGGGGGGAGGGVAAKTYGGAIGDQGLEDWAIASGRSGNYNANNTLYYSTTSYDGGTGASGSSSYSGSISISVSASYTNGGARGMSYSNSDYTTDTQQGFTISPDAKAFADTYATKTKSGSAGQFAVTLIESADMIALREKLSDIEAEYKISKYFDITEITLETDLTKTVSKTANADGSYTMVYSNTSYGEVARYTYRVTANADGSSSVQIYDCSFIPGFVITETGTTPFVSYTSNLLFTTKLTPKEGFLGGNDVPVLGGALDGAVDTQPEQNPDCGVRVSQPIEGGGGYNTFNVPSDTTTTAADYANVATSFDPTAGFATYDHTVTYGESLTMDNLFDFVMPDISGENAWRADFVTLSHTDESEVITPLVTTSYPVFFKLAAKAAPVLATEGTPVTEVAAEGIATVYIELPITYNLTNLSHNGETVIMSGDTLSFRLTPAQGYLLPDSISITDVDGASVSFTYDAKGNVTVTGVVKPLTVTADAKVRTYVIHYVYETGPDGTSDRYDDPTPYEAGAAIDCTAKIAELTPTAQKIGYEYKWTADTAGDTVPTTMPANDLWIYGKYERVTRSLTVRYVYADGTEAAPTYTVAAVAFEDTYSIPSPVINGYLADLPVVSGTMGTEDITVTVTYTASQNQLLILYLKPDGEELARESYTVATDAAYSYPAKSFVGYTASVPTIEGTMSGDASVTVTVQCLPNTYALTFLYQGGYGAYDSATFASAFMEATGDRRVEFDNVYNYNAASATYEALPVPQMLGFEFEGWYTDPTFAQGSLVEDATVVSTEGDRTLYAKWKSQEFTLTVRYNFIYVEGDFVPSGKTVSDIQNVELVELTQMLAYGEAYLINPNFYEGYTPYTRFGMTDQESILVNNVPTLQGTMPATNRVITVTYTINVYDILFEDAGQDYITYSDAATVDPSVSVDNFTTVWKAAEIKHGVSPVYDLAAPVQAQRDEYTYTFTGWKSADTLTEYAGVSPAFPAATEDEIYYAMYNADENIVILTASSTDYYFQTVSDALAYLKSNLSGAVTMTLRRNPGNPQQLNVTDDPIALPVKTSSVSLTVELGGLRVYAENGVTPLSNPASSYIALTVRDTSATPGSLEVTNDAGSAVALENRYSTLYVRDAVTISATSNTGSATAIYNVGSTLYLYGAATITAESNTGKAIAVNNGSSMYIQSGADATITATSTGGNATAIDNSSTLYLYAAANITATSTSGNAIAIENSSSMYFYSGATATVTAMSTEGNATAISNASTLTFNEAATVKAVAPAGLAIGVSNPSSSMYGSSSSGASTAATIMAEGYEAIGIDMDSNYLYLYYGKVLVSATERAVGILDVTTFTPYAGSLVQVTSEGDAIGLLAESASLTFSTSTSSTDYEITVSGDRSAIGVKLESGRSGTFRNASAMTKPILVTSSSGTAYGVYNNGTVSSEFGASLEVTGVNAYGVYNNGTFTVSSAGLKAYADVKATATAGEGIGLLNVSASAVGSTSYYVDKGYFYGSTYALASRGGKVYISGNDLYFKNDANADFFENVEIELIDENGDGVTDYQIVIADAQSKYADYYRLARQHTLTFVTGPGSPIESITAFYRETLPEIKTELFGYELVNWYREEAYTNVWGVPTYMPDESLTVYAKWNRIEYIYTLDSKTYTLNLYASTTATTPAHTKTLSGADVTLTSAEVGDSVSVSSNLMTLSYGWFTADGEYVVPNGSLAQYADENGVINLYKHKASLSGSYSTTRVQLETTSVKTAFIDMSYYTSSTYGYYMYFVAPKDGNYSISYVNYRSSSFNSSYANSCYVKTINVIKCGNDGTVTTLETLSAPGKSSPSTSNYDQTQTYALKAGEILALKVYRGYSNSSSSYDTYIYARVNADVEASKPSTYTVYGERNTFNVDMGTVDLPLYTNADKPGYKFNGWTGTDVNGSIVELTTDLINTTAWKDQGVLDLTSVWTEKLWKEYAAEGRDFTSFETTDAVTVLDNGAVSLRFTRAELPTTAASLVFEGGLPAGTMLTLIDRSEAQARYYFYTLTADTTSLDLTLFTEGATGTAFSGKSTDMTLQIHYGNAEVSLTAEAVHLYHEGEIYPDADINYGLVDLSVGAATLPDYSLEYDDEFYFDDGYSLGDNDVAMLGALDPTDRLVVLIDFGTLRMAPGIRFAVNGVEGTLYGQSLMLIDLGITAGSATADQAYSLAFALRNMRFNEFTDATVSYRLCVAPAASLAEYSFQSDAIIPLYESVQRLTLTESSAVKADQDTVDTEPGQSFEVRFESAYVEGDDLVPEVYIYSMVNGVPTVNNNSIALLEGLTVDDFGLISSDTGAVLDAGVFKATVSASAQTGSYCLKFVYGDKYVYVNLVVK